MKLNSIQEGPKDHLSENQIQSLKLHVKSDSLATVDPPYYQHISAKPTRVARQIQIHVLTKPSYQFLLNQEKLSNLKITSDQEEKAAHKLFSIALTKADQLFQIDNSYPKQLKEPIDFEIPIINDQNDINSSEKDSISKEKYIPQLKNSFKNINLISRNLSESSKVEKKRFGPKEKKIYKNNHPTKNFLASFKMAHIYYLQKYLGKEYVDSFLYIQRLEKQNGITKKDFVDLYKIPQFEGIFQKMFCTKQLFRNLMLSKSRIQHRKVHQKKLFNFEKAFKTKQFLRIE